MTTKIQVNVTQSAAQIIRLKATGPQGIAGTSGLTEATHDVLDHTGLPGVNTVTGGFVSHYHFCEDTLFAGTTPVWRELESQSDGGAIGYHTATGASYSEMDRYVTAALATTVIPAGDWSFILYAKISALQKTGTLRAQIYRVDSAGAIVGSVLGTAETAAFGNTNVVGVPCSCYIGEQTGWATTDRIGVVISGKRGADTATVTWYHDMSLGYGSAMETPITLLHNQMNGLNQGDYRHLTEAQYNALVSLLGA
jgi:hypothetical protein